MNHQPVHFAQAAGNWPHPKSHLDAPTPDTPTTWCVGVHSALELAELALEVR